MQTKPAYEDLTSRIEQLKDELSQTRKKLAHANEIQDRYNSLFNQSLDGVYLMDLDGNILRANPAALNLVGVSEPTGRSVNFTDVISEDQHEQWFKILEEIKTTGSQKTITQFALKSKNGEDVHTEASGMLIYRDGEPYRIQGIIRDVTHRIHMAASLKQNWEALKNAPIGVYIVQNHKFVWVNQRFVSEIGYSEDELMKMEAMDLVISQDRSMLKENMVLMLKGKSTYPFEYRTIHPVTKKPRWVRGEVVSTIYDGKRATVGYYSDIDNLMTQSIMDSLTGLYNRRYILQLAEQMVDNANRYHHALSFIMLDVDYFKEFNDTFGHLEGDKALAKIGAILKDIIRKVDIPGRYGGEEFCILLPHTPIDDAKDVAMRIMQSIEHQTAGSDLAKGITVSLGLSQLSDNMTLQNLIKSADDKLYLAKSQGRNQMVAVS